MTRGQAGVWIGLLGVLCVQVLAATLTIQDRLSPWNAKRPNRKQTRLVVLHTTEGGTKGSLAKLRRYGEAHYLVDEKGAVFRIMSDHKVALHAGRSMWNGTRNLDEHSIGIEVTGYHNRAITPAQITSLRLLLDQLQKRYRIPDENVIPHSMVAYGTPNRWHKKSHRGRKRCAMQFADLSLRQKLGLDRQPLFDPDVRAGRLIEADPYLARMLYRTARVGDGSHATSIVAPPGGEDGANIITKNRSAWDVARDRYRLSSTQYIFPDGTRKRGDEISNWRKIPPGTQVVIAPSTSENAPEELLEIGVHGMDARELAGDEVRASTTIYFLTDGRVRQGTELTNLQISGLSKGTKMLVGYVHGGYVTARRSAFDIAGAKWNHSSTFYRYPDGSIISGDHMREGAIVPMSMVFFQR